MARLYSDLIDSGSRRYFFGLESAPGGISNSAPAALRITGYAPLIQELTEVFRNPATAALQIQGLFPTAQPYLLPAQAPLSIQGRVPTLLTQITITNALPPDYTDLPDNAPTIIYVATITPPASVLTLASLEHNVTPGGNIGFISPLVGALSLQGRAPNYPREAGLASLSIAGFAPSLISTLVIEPQTGSLAMSSLAATLSTPFMWIDDARVATPTWIDDPRA